MRVAVIGSGYVGLVSGACFAQVGNQVICVDVNEQKVQKLKEGIIPIYEPGLSEMILDNLDNKRIDFTTNIRYALENSDIVFIAVGTPMGDDGSADLQYVLSVAEQIGANMSHHLYVVDKSTVPVGTADKVKNQIQFQLQKRNSDLTFDVISNPEFLKEGTAINDFLYPDRVVIGADNEKAFEVMRELYKPFITTSNRLVEMDIKSAELTKYAANAFLATKISFINEIANICELVGANINKVRGGIGLDRRIGFNFMYPGCGYGGSCFPKDVQALVKTAVDFGYNPRILNAVEDVNKDQKKVIVNKIFNYFGKNLSGLVFAVWGLSFKPNTDDMREASSITIINMLTEAGAKIKAYDPKAIYEAQVCYLKDNLNVAYVDNKYDATIDADGLILLTEWDEFKTPNFYKLVDDMNKAIIFDGRNQYDAIHLNEIGFTYIQIGV